MSEKQTDIFDDIEEDFKKKCLYTDNDNLYLFGNLFCEDEVVSPEEAVLDLPELAGTSDDNDNDNDNDDNTENDEDEQEMIKYLTKDPVAKQQFEYDRSTCFTNDVPEIGVNMSLSVAPAEGYTPKSILFDPDWDWKTFSAKDCKGNGNLKYERDIASATLRNSDYFSQRLYNCVDNKYSESPAYLFSAVQYTESKLLQGNLNIAFQRGKKTETNESVSYTLDDPWRVLDDIKGTPRFYQKKKMEFIAKLENLGPFTIFLTLSCGDRRWSENFSSLLELEGHTVELSNEWEEVRVDGIPLSEFIAQNEGQHEFIRKNILNATRIFEDRVKKFIKNIIMSEFGAIPCSFYSYKTEWQLRGASHIHMVMWVNYKELTRQYPEFDNLESSIENMCNDKILTEEEEDVIKRFADMISSVSLKDPATTDIVREVNFHHCTRACRKYSSFCRFHFPRFPVAQTLVATPNKVKYPDPEERNRVGEWTKLALSKVKNILKDEAVMAQIVKDTKSLDIKSRIIAVLLSAGLDEFFELSSDHKDELYNEYLQCLKLSFTGYQIVLERDIDEIYINNYNSEWIRAWNANLDIQIVLDHYAIVTYIMEYMNKDESGTSEFILKALKDSENGSLRENLKLVKNTFQTHRQIGECEAIYRLFSTFCVTGSNIGTQFVHTGFRHNKSRFLRQISKEEAEKRGNEAIVITDHPDKFFEETTSLVDRYDNRPESLRHITLSQFIKRYTLGKQSNTDDDDDDDDDNDIDVDSPEEAVIDDIYCDFIISYDPENRHRLPEVIKIGPRTMKLRKPLCLRFHKYKLTSEPHEHFFSQLRLYHPHNKTDLDIWEQDEEKCREAFLKNEEAIKYVRQKVMKYQQKVEENQAKAQAEYDAAIGDILDSTKEQDMTDCRDEGMQDPDDFVALDPSLAPRDKSELCEIKASKYVKIELHNLDDLLIKTRNMDTDQRRIVRIGVEFASNVRKSRNKKGVKRPSPPYIVVQGSAGSGKSFVINTMTEWMERIFRQTGDNPNYPYILRLAYTGTAANIISGQTLHSTLKLPFGNKFQSLTTKEAAEKREQLSNLQVLIIDEYSMVRPDMLNQIDLRLKEIKLQPGLLFGGVAIILFGDIMQLKPVSGKYIFEEPAHPMYKLSNSIERLWDNFDKYFLTFNHRQGEDLVFSRMLNRIRVGRPSDTDIDLLKTRVFPENDPQVPRDALYLVATNNEVNKINEERLKEMPGEMKQFDTTILSKTGSNRKPTITNSGEIKNTMLQAHLKLKIGAKVMMTYNVDTIDGLTNGARGELIGWEVDESSPERRVKRLYVHFIEEKVGKEKRKHCHITPSLRKLQLQHPDKLPTPVDRLEFKYSNSNSRTSSENIAINFPLRLCFATTGHRIQGQTVKKPNNLVVNLKKVFQAALSYVIISRVQSLNQIYFIDDVYPEKIYPNEEATNELEKMFHKSIKPLPSKISLNILSLNIRSLPKHLPDLVLEEDIAEHDLILLQQTCLTGDHQDSFDIEQYNCHFNSSGAGGGLAVYYKEGFSHVRDIKEDQYQMTKFSSTEYDVISTYRSTNSSQESHIQFLTNLEKLINNKKKTIVTGDFNTVPETSVIGREMTSWGFKQVITYPTHLEGNCIDHCYVSDNISTETVKIKKTPVYYTDHDKIQIYVK